MTVIGKATLALLATVALTTPAVAQQQTPKGPTGPVKNWGSIFAIVYPDAGTIRDPGTGSAPGQVWNFGSGFGLGASVQRLVGQSLQLGIEGSIAPSVGVEITDSASAATTSDHAKLGELMATGRIMTGGGGGLGLYLSGGIGTFIWGMPAPAPGTDADFAVRTAAGLEYQTSARRGLFLEWGQFWDFHQHAGVKSNTAKFGQIRGGLRIGW
jgi:hypothetical protein